MPGPILLVLILAAAVYLGVIVHEAGHALIGRAVGFVVTSVGLGIAGPFLVLPMGGTRLYLGLTRPFQGITFAFLPRVYPDRKRMAAFVSGGIAANALCAALAIGLALCLPTGRLKTTSAMFAAINAMLATSSLIPVSFRVGGAMLRSDGRLLLDVLRVGSLRQPPADVIQNAQGCRRLWQAVGDRLMDRLYTLNAALSWIDLGATAKAESVFAEAVAIDVAHPYIDWLEEVARTNLALAKGDPAEASAALSRAESFGETFGEEGGYLLALLRAGLLLIEDRQGEAMAALERLPADPVGRTRPEFGLSALTVHLRVACVAGDQAAVSELQSRYEAERLRHLSDVRDLQVYRALAHFAASRGDDARDDYRRALKAMAPLAAAWRDPHDKAAFVDAHRSLIEEAMEALGVEDVAPLIAAVETQEPDPAILAREQSRRRWALRLMLINAGLFVPLWLAALSIRPRGAPIIFLAVVLGLFTVLGAIGVLLDLAVRRLLPSLRRLSGAILLTVALMPWLVELIFCVVTTLTP
ncbi:hypothetical protein [Paludisphaera rhizosphaerae]|uniref:hypothetical protein n=1 Tax=Paludisphaera rhizosphaerae TaxID=2711216 RepID=UPI0013EA944B|nr:hypothetical protein [Paludisphaera rhizosphaerae]